MVIVSGPLVAFVVWGAVIKPNIKESSSAHQEIWGPRSLPQLPPVAKVLSTAPITVVFLKMPSLHPLIGLQHTKHLKRTQAQAARLSLNEHSVRAVCQESPSLDRNQEVE